MLLLLLPVLAFGLETLGLRRGGVSRPVVCRNYIGPSQVNMSLRRILHRGHRWCSWGAIFEWLLQGGSSAAGVVGMVLNGLKWVCAASVTLLLPILIWFIVTAADFNTKLVQFIRQFNQLVAGYLDVLAGLAALVWACGHIWLPPLLGFWYIVFT